MCHKVIESHEKETKTIPTTFNEKKAICKTQNCYILLVFLLITIVFLIVARFYYYLVKYRAIQKHLWSFYLSNSKLKEIMS